MKKFEIVVRAIITDKQNRILLVKRAKNPQKDKWCLPGGKVNFGEKSELAIIREIKEELNLKLMPKFLILIPCLQFFPDNSYLSQIRQAVKK